MAITLEIKVIPSSGRSGFVLDKSGRIKCYLKNPPEHGKANKELIKLVAKSVGVPQDAVSIIVGATSRKKKIKIDKELTQEWLFACLGLSKQMSLLH